MRRTRLDLSIAISSRPPRRAGEDPRFRAGEACRASPRDRRDPSYGLYRPRNNSCNSGVDEPGTGSRRIGGRAQRPVLRQTGSLRDRVGHDCLGRIRIGLIVLNTWKCDPPSASPCRATNCRDDYGWPTVAAGRARRSASRVIGRAGRLVRQALPLNT